MKKYFFALLFSFCSSASASELCSILSGAKVISEDGKFLGVVAGPYSSDSIFNEYGSHGSEYSTDSIWNEYGTYGGEYSTKSPFNPYTTSPPFLVKDGKAIAYLSVNKSLNAAVNPWVLKSCYD